jgi:predicted glycosyltransferase
VLTGDYAHPSLGKKEIKYAGYHELAYLHPKHFAPDESVLDLLGVNNNEKYIILRFVAWKATHDYGHKGITYLNKLKAIHEFGRYAKVFISSESELPDDLVKYRIKIPPDKMHDALAFSCLLFGESSTMAEEGAMLGVPSIYLNEKGTHYTNHLERAYDLIYNFAENESDQNEAIEKGIELLKSNVKDEWQKRRDRMLADKIDVTAFLVWFVENYPDSEQIMRNNPDYQWRFK